MIIRSIAPLIASLRAGYPVLVITGPRQSGKTTLAQACFADLPYVSLEDPMERASFQADPRAWLARFPDGAVLDEVQRVPDLPSWLQGLVDADKRMGRWVLTGSQQYMVLDRVTQSLAGRAALLELMPFSQAELKNAGREIQDPATAIWTGYYPPLFDRAVDPSRWLGDYLATYLERDVRSVTAVRDLVRFGSFVRLCATRIGQSLNLASMAAEIGIDAKTARDWLSILVAGYIVHLLPPYHANLGKRVVKHPKLYFLDTGLACRLLGIANSNILSSHPSWGALVENWMIAEVIKVRRERGQRTDTLFWWRSHDGLEVDLLFDAGMHLIPVEIKATQTPGPDDCTALRRFTALAGTKATAGVVFHLGATDATMLGIRIAPWQQIDTVVSGWQ